MKRHFLLVMALIIVGMSSCLQKDIELKLPPFESQLVVECYLRPGAPVFLSITETQDYFADSGVSLQNLYLFKGIVATLSYEGKKDTFRLNPMVNIQDRNFFNYYIPDTIDFKQGVTYFLEVVDTINDRTATAETAFLPTVPIRDANPVWNDNDSSAYMLINFVDPPGTNYYRFQVVRHRDSTRTIVDFSIKDGDFENSVIPLGTSPEFKVGDTAIVNLYALTKAHFDYLASSDAAAQALGNPFGQPSRIISNVTGALGIFSALPKETLVVPVIR